MRRPPIVSDFLTIIDWQEEKVQVRKGRVAVKVRLVGGLTFDQTVQNIVNSIRPARKRRDLEAWRLASFELEGSQSIRDALHDLNARGDVVIAGPAFPLQGTTTPSDSDYIKQWAYHAIEAEPAWDLETGTDKVLLGILDAGLPLDAGGVNDHEDYDWGRITTGVDEIDGTMRDRHGHGTSVAGVLAALANNATASTHSIAPMNWGSPVRVCRILDENKQLIEEADGLNIPVAIHDILSAASAGQNIVINMSLISRYADDLAREALAQAQAVGAIVCCGAGDEFSATVEYPAAYSRELDNVLAVGSVEEVSPGVYDIHSFKSPSGDAMTVVAPGKDIHTTLPNYAVTGYTSLLYGSDSGTSLATPFVTGLISLMWSRNQDLSYQQIISCLKEAAWLPTSVPGPHDTSWGYGLIQAYEAVDRVVPEINVGQQTVVFLNVEEGVPDREYASFEIKSCIPLTFNVSAGPTVDPASAANTNFVVSASSTYSSSGTGTWEVFEIAIDYTGTLSGDVGWGSVEIECVETGEKWTFNLLANTMPAVTSLMIMTLDSSGSMGVLSDVGAFTRLDVLKFSSKILIDYIGIGSAVGLVTFTTDADEPLLPGTITVADSTDPVRTNLRNTVDLLTPGDIGTYTSIGDGLEKAQFRLNQPHTHANEAIMLVTDGKETAGKFVSEVASMLHDHIYAVGVGTPSEVDTATLDAVTGGSGEGYTLVTGGLDDDSEFKLGKYFLQVFAGISNQDVIVDPSGRLRPGQTVAVKLFVTDLDRDIDVIAMMPGKEVFDLVVIAPDGTRLDKAAAATMTDVTFVSGDNVSYFQIKLPAQLGGATNHGGKWRAELTLTQTAFDNYVAGLGANAPGPDPRRFGLAYQILTHTRSHLNFHARALQSDYRLGATVALRSLLTEWGRPISGPATVDAAVTFPDGTRRNIALATPVPGVYEADLITTLEGVYTCVLRARGATANGEKFQREMVVTGVAVR